MNTIEFSESDKAKAFDELSELFYKSNFGRATKSEIELLMFHFYLEKIITESMLDNGSVDYNKCSDYRISKELGITQQRVRNLKIKKQLAFPIDFKWELSFASLVKNARFDQETHKITIGIPDPNLYLELQNFIEEKGGYIEKQMNSKLLQMRAEYYIDLVAALEDDKSRKRIIKQMKTDIKNDNKDEKLFDEKDIGKSLIDSGVNVTTILANISSLISPINHIGQALISLLVGAAK